VTQTEDDTLEILHATVHCYLRTLQAVADAVSEACPPIGGPCRQRLSRLRARLAFDTSAGAIEESCAATSRELKEYAGMASGYVERHRVELRRAVAGLEDMVRAIAQRQDFYGARLREFALQMENTPASPNAAPQVAGLLSCLESMSHESQSLLRKMREEMARVEARLVEAEITDPVTGLMNRREMQRRIQAVQAHGDTPVLLLFDFREPLPSEVAQQVAARLGSQFRHNDLISRWSDCQFLVLFQGLAETARLRAEQVEPWIAGRYLLDSGATLQTVVQVRLVDAPAGALELAPAP